jgi:hypothetical protein
MLATLISSHNRPLTNGRKSQLPAGHLSINSIPLVITHSAPDIVVADLHTPTHGVTSSPKPDGTLDAF